MVMMGDDGRASVNLADQLQWSALHWACVHGRVDVVRTLLDAGAPLDARSVSGATALVEAVRSGRPNLVQLLVDRRADLHCVTRNGRRAHCTSTICRSFKLFRPLSTVEYTSVARVSTVDSGLTNLIHDRCISDVEWL